MKQAAPVKHEVQGMRVGAQSHWSLCNDSQISVTTTTTITTQEEHCPAHQGVCVSLERSTAVV